MEKVRYMISDAANIVNVESHVLRYWEEELDLNIPRNEMGHRYYTKENIQEFQKIKELKEQGYQLKAIRMIVHNGSLNGQAVELAAGMPEEAEKKPDLRQIPQTSQNTLNGAKMSVANDRENTAAVKGETPPKAAVKGKESSLPADIRRGELENQQQSILENTDKMAQFTDLMTEIVGKALAANNQELSKCISEDVGEQVLKEMNYLMREQEEADEERFRKLDAAIRGNLKKKKRPPRISCTENRGGLFCAYEALSTRRLFLADCSCRTNACACTTANARTSVNNVLSISLRNCSYRTLWLTCTTANARIRNYECHLYSLLNK